MVELVVVSGSGAPEAVRVGIAGDTPPAVLTNHNKGIYYEFKDYYSVIQFKDFAFFVPGFGKVVIMAYTRIIKCSHDAKHSGVFLTNQILTSFQWKYLSNKGRLAYINILYRQQNNPPNKIACARHQLAFAMHPSTWQKGTTELEAIGFINSTRKRIVPGQTIVYSLCNDWKRNNAMCKPKRKGTDVIIGNTLRYKVFKRDKYKCQICGATAADGKLEIDHIKPTSKGGLDEMSNLQVLCRRCNSGKSDDY